MASQPTFGPRPGESAGAYLERLNNERLARAKASGQDNEVTPPVTSEVSQPAMTVAAAARSPAGSPLETAKDAREARRAGVEAAIARDAEPAGRFEAIAAALPPSVQAAAGLSIERVRILKSDVPVSLPRSTPMAAFMSHVRKVIKALLGQGVSERCLEDTAEACIVLEFERGFTWAGMKAIATIARYCVRHVQRALRLLEAGGLFDVLGVRYREGDEWWRDANIYVATMDAEPPPVPADVDAPDPVIPASVSRALGGGARLAAWFGLVLRAGGLNTSPASNYRTHPAPT